MWTTPHQLGPAPPLSVSCPPIHRWASQRLYTHVAADNDVALRLYNGCGFKEYSVDAQALEGGSVLGECAAFAQQFMTALVACNTDDRAWLLVDASGIS